MIGQLDSESSCMTQSHTRNNQPHLNKIIYNIRPNYKLCKIYVGESNKSAVKIRLYRILAWVQVLHEACHRPLGGMPYNGPRETHTVKVLDASYNHKHYFIK